MGAGNRGGVSFGAGGAVTDDAAFGAWLDEVAPAAQGEVPGLEVALAEVGLDLATFLLELIVRPVVVAARRNTRITRGARS